MTFMNKADHKHNYQRKSHSCVIQTHQSAHIYIVYPQGGTVVAMVERAKVLVGPLTPTTLLLAPSLSILAPLFPTPLTCDLLWMRIR